MTVKNLSTGKTYQTTEELYNKNLKGKENWQVIPDVVKKPNQKIENTIQPEKGKIKFVPEMLPAKEIKTDAPVTTKGTKKRNSKTQK